MNSVNVYKGKFEVKETAKATQRKGDYHRKDQKCKRASFAYTGNDTSITDKELRCYNVYVAFKVCIALEKRVRSK